MKAKISLLFIFLVIQLVPGEAQQKPGRFGFEVSGGPSLATREIPSGKLTKGLGFDGVLHYDLFENSGLYAGWGWNKFSSGTSFTGDNADFEETGYMFGLQFKHSIDGLRSSYYVRAGGLYNHIEIENESGSLIGDTGHGLGWQLAAGIDIPVAYKWSFSPVVKYNFLNRDIENEGIETKLAMHYLTVRVGIFRKF
jgi:hypothetical protein